MKIPVEENFRLLVIIVALIFVNLIAGSFVLRWDLTKEKRYSLSEVSQQTARAMDAPMLVTVYLDGDFPPSIRKYQNAVETTLIELAQYSYNYINYNFVDIANNVALNKELIQRGFRAIPIRVRTSATAESQKLMWPIIHIRYRDRELYVDLTEGSIYPDGSINFEKAEAELEYKIVSAMRRLLREEGGIVALLQGHGETSTKEFAVDLGREIQNSSYQLFLFDMKQSPGEAINPSIDVLLIFQPTQAFSERDKYEIDQYLMRGGSILWVLDLQEVDLDLYEKRATLSRLRELNLDDMFLKYGFKINYNLIQDLESEKTEIFIPGPSGGTFDSHKWIYFPMIFNFPPHPINRNAEAALFRYGSSIDTFFQPSVQKHVFMTTSELSRTLNGTIAIDLVESISTPPPPALFQDKGPYITGLYMEGIFNSLFVGRENSTVLLDSLANTPPTALFGPANSPQAPGKMVIISDGDFVKGKKFRGKSSPFLPYNNKTIIMNAIDYMAGDEALTQIRSKEVVIRNLDKEKIVGNISLIRLVNVGFPVLLMVIFGWLRSLWRKKRYAQIVR